jgi:hypothetical protein
MRDYSVSVEVELSQSGNQPLKSTLRNWNVYQSLELSKPISVQVSSDWSRSEYGSAPSLTNCILEIGVGDSTTSVSNPVPIFVLGSIPVSFSTGTGSGPFGSETYSWKVEGTGTVPGPDSSMRSDITPSLTLIFKCESEVVDGFTWLIRSIVGPPTVVASPSLSIENDTAYLTVGQWQAGDYLGVSNYGITWYYCSERSIEAPSCKQLGDTTFKPGYPAPGRVGYKLNDTLKGTYLASMIQAFNDHGSTSAWTELQEYASSSPEKSTPETSTPERSSSRFTANQRTLATFSESATGLTSLQRGQVKAAVEANPNAEKFICTGIRYYSQPMSVNIMVRKRAKAACDYAKELNPSLSTWFQSKPTQARSYAGKVLLTIKSPPKMVEYDDTQLSPVDTFTPARLPSSYDIEQFSILETSSDPTYLTVYINTRGHPTRSQYLGIKNQIGLLFDFDLNGVADMTLSSRGDGFTAVGELVDSDGVLACNVGFERSPFTNPAFKLRPYVRFKIPKDCLPAQEQIAIASWTKFDDGAGDRLPETGFIIFQSPWGLMAGANF